jgi:hypothetical protein
MGVIATTSIVFQLKEASAEYTAKTSREMTHNLNQRAHGCSAHERGIVVEEFDDIRDCPIKLRLVCQMWTECQEEVKSFQT